MSTDVADTLSVQMPPGMLKTRQTFGAASGSGWQAKLNNAAHGVWQVWVGDFAGDLLDMGIYVRQSFCSWCWQLKL